MAKKNFLPPHLKHLSRKEQRKIMRKEKKKYRSQQKMKLAAEQYLESPESPVTKKKPPKSPNKPKIDRTDNIKFEKLKKQMDAERMKRLQEDNAREDRLIRSLEKKLKLNVKRKENLPKSFVSEGLDYLLEVCDYDKFNSSMNKDKEPMGFESETEFAEDFSTILQPKNEISNSSTVKTKNKKNAKKSKPTKIPDESKHNDISSRLKKLNDFVQEEAHSNNEESLEEEEEKQHETISKTIPLKTKSNNKIKNVKKIKEANKRKDVSSRMQALKNFIQKETNSQDDESLEDEEESESPQFQTSKTTCTENHKNTKDTKKRKQKKKQKNDITSRMQKLKNFIQKETECSDESTDDEGDENEPSAKKRCTTDEHEAAENNENNSKSNLREDIYGRLISEDGTVIEQNRPTKYIPPHLRANNDSEKLQKLRKQMKGLLNRLTGQNMHSIATQIELMYASNSRHDVNTTLSKLIQESLIAFTLTPMRMIIEHALLVAVLHANIGEEVGAFVLQDITEEFQKLIKNSDIPVEDKQIDNVVAILVQLYNFKVFHACLIYEILDKLLERFHEKDIDLILLIVKNVGFNLRKDDPVKLKEVIFNVQKKANAAVSEESSRTKFMLETLLAIKNNNKLKILQIESDYVDHLKKCMKTFVHNGKYVSELKITFEDLLNAEVKGRWWIVGSAWSGNTPSNEKSLATNQGHSFDEKILNLAKKHRMNTDVRKNIFCILMSAEDFLDAFEKLLKLGLKGGQCQEIIYVTMHCLLQEKDYNPYYSFIAEQFSSLSRRYQITIQYCSWDKFKDIDSLTNQQITNLANFLAYLIQNKKLPISVLKVLQFTEMNKPLVRLIRQLMLNLLMSNSESVIADVFGVISKSEKLFLLREGLQLFLHHFILKEANKELGNGTSDDYVEKLQKNVEIAVNAMRGGDTQF